MDRTRKLRIAACGAALALALAPTGSAATQDQQSTAQDRARQGQSDKGQSDKGESDKGESDKGESDKGDAQQRTREATQDASQDAEARKKAAREKQQQEEKRAQEAANQRERPQQTGRGIPQREVAAVKRYLAEVRKHRGRLARIERLRELAVASGDRARVTALGELERKELARMGKQESAAAGAISPETMAQIEAKLAKGGGPAAGGDEGRPPREKPSGGSDDTGGAQDARGGRG